MSEANLPIAAAYTIIPFHAAGSWEFERPEFAGARPAALSVAEIQRLEIALGEAIAQQNEFYEQQYAAYWQEHPESGFNREFVLIDLPRYTRQYVPFVLPTGARMAWVNLMRRPPPSWRTHLHLVLDGGNHYFNATLEVATGKLLALRINGSA